MQEALSGFSLLLDSPERLAAAAKRKASKTPRMSSSAALASNKRWSQRTMSVGKRESAAVAAVMIQQAG